MLACHNASIRCEDASMADEETPSGKARGGIARRDALSPEKRVEIARRAAEIRWTAPKATHTGELHIGDLVIECAVLPDGKRVLSQRGVGKALGRRSAGRKQADAGGEKLPFFLDVSSLKPFISN